MKIVKIYLLLLLTMFFATACEKVIEVDLNSAAPRHVIEGFVTNGEGPYHTVKITETKSFSEDNYFKPITNAIVALSDSYGNSVYMEPNEEGIFINSTLEGIPGRTYHLKVEVDGHTYTSSSTMPLAVSLDTLFIEKFQFFGRTVYFPAIRFQDPADEENYYRYVLYINGEATKNIFVHSDRNRNGMEVSRNIRYRDDEKPIERGDIITLEKQCIDKAVYKYFDSLNETIRQSAATPANPVSNISGGALGYFSAHTVESQTVAVDQVD